LNNYRCFGILDGHKGNNSMYEFKEGKNFLKTNLLILSICFIKIDLVKCLQINGSRLVTGSRDKTIRQWDLSKLISHPESVTNLSELSFTSTASIPEANGLSNVGDNCWIASLEGHSGSITCLHFENNS